MFECTFKPNLMTSVSSVLSESNLGLNKSHQLYSMHQNKMSQKQSLKASKVEELDKECTFFPQTNKPKPARRLSRPAKQIDETIFRMYKGRKEHELKRDYLSRGEQSKTRHSSLRNEVGRIPHLILDVNLGEQVERLIIYEGDEDRLAEVAHEFALKNQLEKESEGTLLKMLETELANLQCRSRGEGRSPEA